MVDGVGFGLSGVFLVVDVFLECLGGMIFRLGGCVVGGEVVVGRVASSVADEFGGGVGLIGVDEGGA